MRPITQQEKFEHCSKFHSPDPKSCCRPQQQNGKDQREKTKLDHGAVLQCMAGDAKKERSRNRCMELFLQAAMSFQLIAGSFSVSSITYGFHTSAGTRDKSLALSCHYFNASFAGAKHVAKHFGSFWARGIVADFARWRLATCQFRALGTGVIKMNKIY